jgi:MFS family permease
MSSVNYPPLDRFQNIRVYCTSHVSSSTSRNPAHQRVTQGWLSLPIGVLSSSVMIRTCLFKSPYLTSTIEQRIHSGVGGGVVTQDYFQSHFGFKGNTARKDEISSNVVSVLQAGAFFGALGSAPISAKIGRRWTLFAFSLLFSLGAVSRILKM